MLRILGTNFGNADAVISSVDVEGDCGDFVPLFVDDPAELAALGITLQPDGLLVMGFSLPPASTPCRSVFTIAMDGPLDIPVYSFGVEMQTDVTQ